MPLVYPSLVTYPPAIFYELEKEWPNVVSGDYPDGSQDILSLADNPVRRWYAHYKAYLTSEKNLFRALADSARYHPDTGSAISFSFTPLNDVALTGVQFDKEGLSCTAEPGSGQSIWTITVKLIKRP